MNADRWREITRIYGAVVARAPDQRAGAVAALCGDDPALRREVESLLDESDDRPMVLDRPPWDMARGVHPADLHLTPGTRLGPYPIVGLLGVGGMGEVYRARDLRLNRDVALKLLPAAFAGDPDRLARFTREAQVLASLSHPNIGAIYGLEEGPVGRVGPAGEVVPAGRPLQFLVMELAEGDDLSQRLAGGAIPLDEALPIARQIAEALEAAHEQGIIHRDLKPANIKVRPDGTVKVLDFGLAKVVEAGGAGAPGGARAPGRAGRAGTTDMPGTTGASGSVGSAALAGVNDGPTILTPEARHALVRQGAAGGTMTSPGMILGTAAYMSPEQARGKPVDRRADIWAFGCVLFEMVAGQRAFKGDTASDLIASVLTSEPNWRLLPPAVPADFRRLLHRCLEKNPRSRLQAIGEARVQLEAALNGAPNPFTDASDAPAASGHRRSWVATGVAAAICIGALLASAGVYLLTRPASPKVVRTAITTSASTELRLFGNGRDVAITPDGSRVVYSGANQLLVRELNKLEPAVLSGLGSPQGVFISPDGQWIGFFDGIAMKRVAITGGPPVTIATVDGGPRGATWGPDGTIVFATATDLTALQRVSAAGGTPTVLTQSDRERGDADHLWPEFLPGGKAVLFTILTPNRSLANAQIALLDVQSGKSRVLMRGGSDAHYVASGHLVYGAAGTLRAVPFDLERLEVNGPPVPVVEGVNMTRRGAATVAVAANGSLVYVPGGASDYDRRTVVSIDRQGHGSELPGLPPDSYWDVRVSPDGKWVALANQSQVSIYGLANQTLRRLTDGPGWDRSPLWTPDGKRIIFTSDRAGYPELFWRLADGTGDEQRLLTRGKDLLDLRANGWSTDGRQLLLSEVPASLHNSIQQMSVAAPDEGKVLIDSNFSNDLSAVSPDGHWLAYHSRSTVSDLAEIYVERYPELGSRQQISTGGGRLPNWSRSGRELIYMSEDARQLLSVPIQLGSGLVAGHPEVLFNFPMLAQGGGNRPYDVTPDGRFLVIRSEQPEARGGPAANLVLVQNWFEELKRLVPTK